MSKSKYFILMGDNDKIYVIKHCKKLLKNHPPPISSPNLTTEC